MDWSGVRYWYDGLEPRDKWLLASLIALALLFLTPWRKHLATEGAVQPKEGEAYLLLAPGPGSVKEVRALKGKVLAAGELAFSYVPQVEPPSYAPQAYLPGYAYNSMPYQEDERKIRERYAREITEANSYITSTQQQLNRAYSEQVRLPRGGISYDVQLAQNALVRAQQAPNELRGKMEQELAALRVQRDAYVKLNQSAQAQLYARPMVGTNNAGDLTVTVNDRVWVQSTTLRSGAVIRADQECATLVPEQAAFEVLAAIPVGFAGEIRQGMAATLEVTGWLRDAERIPLHLTRVGNRNLEQEEIAALRRGPEPGGPFVLATFELEHADGRLFPPPDHCQLEMMGSRRCLLQRIFR